MMEEHRKSKTRQKEAIKHGMQCRHGRHRSLGMSNLGKHCLETLHGLTVNIELLSTAPCGCPSSCKKLRHDRSLSWPRKQELQNRWSEEGIAAFETALQLWGRL